MSRLNKRGKAVQSISEKDTGMIRGNLVEKHLPCGKEGCKCKEGELHGPFYYLIYPEGGKQKTLYVRKDKVKEVNEGIRAYKRARESIDKMADMNRKLLKKGGK